MDGLDEHKPIDNFENIQGSQRIGKAFIQRIIINKMDQRERIEAANFVVSWIAFDEEEPCNLQDFRNQEYEFGGNHNTPALAVGYPVAKHKTADPDYQRNEGELPQIN